MLEPCEDGWYWYNNNQHALYWLNVINRKQKKKYVYIYMCIYVFHLNKSYIWNMIIRYHGIFSLFEILKCRYIVLCSPLYFTLSLVIHHLQIESKHNIKIKLIGKLVRSSSSSKLLGGMRYLSIQIFLNFLNLSFTLRHIYRRCS